MVVCSSVEDCSKKWPLLAGKTWKESCFLIIFKVKNEQKLCFHPLNYLLIILDRDTNEDGFTNNRH